MNAQCLMGILFEPRMRQAASSKGFRNYPHNLSSFFSTCRPQKAEMPYPIHTKPYCQGHKTVTPGIGGSSGTGSSRALLKSAPRRHPESRAAFTSKSCSCGFRVFDSSLKSLRAATFIAPSAFGGIKIASKAKGTWAAWPIPLLNNTGCMRLKQ